jgi:hypothetical protein
MGFAPAQSANARRWRSRANQRFALGAGWSSPVARQAHNLKAAGSNPAPATKKTIGTQKISLTMLTRRPTYHNLKSESRDVQILKKKPNSSVESG